MVETQSLDPTCPLPGSKRGSSSLVLFVKTLGIEPKALNMLAFEHEVSHEPCSRGFEAS